ncbi:MAG: 16S rRNA (guanine(966)-N(2))-methyltransferase RsmD [Clostridiales bacterium]|nr:16S rRNA (guanine(966)-N(2))-methyltransferase RsmD [Clostridiales bacterium]
MRVISGKYKGRNIYSPRGEVRPTTDIVKGSLFSILENRGLVEGAAVLDVFCGTGAVGIEALSRGADSCVFVDHNTDNVSRNLDAMGINARLVRADFRRALRLLRGSKFDIIFADPPYAAGYAEEVLKCVFKYDMIKPNGVIIIEHSSSNGLINAPENCIIERRVLGAAALEIITRGDNEGGIGGSV